MSEKLTEEMLSALPDARGHFGAFGGRFVSETLMDSLMTLEKEYKMLKNDPEFQARFDMELADYVGRPTPLYFAERLTRETGGAQIWLKREDLCHTGAHKVNNTIGQALLASFLGKKRIIAELVPASTALRPQPCVPALAWNVTFSWAQRMCSASR